MKLAFSTLGCPDWTFKEITAMAKDFGFNGAEIRGVRSKMYAPDIKAFSDEFWSENKERLEKYKLEIPMLTSGISVKTASENMLAEAKAYADLADKIGASYIRLLADDQIGPTTEVSDDIVAENIKKILAETAENKVMFLVETNGAYSDTKRLAVLLDSIGSDRLGALWDIHHPYRFFSESAEKTWENIGKFVKYVHVKDSAVENGKFKYKMMGKGDMPISDFVDVLKNNGYEGYLSLEWVKRWNQELEEPGIVFAQYINYMKKQLR